ncbi:glycosyltransferase [Streptomyces sp. NPDC001422]|uniref:glycosyltransferase n=1 Tax=Streptomyces sp. NPDC001422 TaxID=3364575 RepID=UPI0036CA103D
MDGIRPNVFITTSHRGVAGELVPVLSRAREYGCHTVLTLRDIYEPPRYTAEFEQLTEADFDSVVIAGPSAVQRWLPRGLVHGPLSRRVHFSGYFPPPTPIREVREAKPQALVLCQVGGGADGRVLLESVLTAIPDVRSSLSRDVQLRLVTGPLMSDADVEAVRARARGEASVQPWLWSPSGELGPDIGRPDLVVSMAGYNSCVEAAWSRAPSILMPRVDPEDREQEVRAALFAGWFRNIASVRTHSSDELAALMVHFLSSGRSVEHADRVIPSDMFARADEVTATVLGPRGTGTATRS